MIRLILMIIFIVCCVCMIGVILMQRGRGGGLAGAFGAGGGSDTLLGGLQSKELVRATIWLACLFMIIAVLLDFIPGQRTQVDLTAFDTGAPMATEGFEEGAGPPIDESAAPLEGSEATSSDVQPDPDVSGSGELE